MKAIWNGAVIAEAMDGQIIEVEGNAYFPPNTIKKEHFKKSKMHTICPWKGEASYYDVVVDGQVNKDAAWYYPQPKEAAEQITGYVAFWRGVEVSN